MKNSVHDEIRRHAHKMSRHDFDEKTRERRRRFFSIFTWVIWLTASGNTLTLMTSSTIDGFAIDLKPGFAIQQYDG